MFGLHKDLFVPEAILLLRCEAGKEGLLQADLEEVAVVLHEQARFIGERLFLVEGDQRSRCGATISDEKLAILNVDVAVDGADSHRLDRQVGCFFTVSEVKLLAQKDLNEN